METLTTTPPAPTPGQVSAGNAYQSLFDAAYFNSKPPAFQPLYNSFSGAQNGALAPLSQADRGTLIAQLIASGYTIDEQIEFWAWDPYMTMFIREQYGYQWVLPGLGAAGTANPDQPSYTGPAPAGAIKVSTLLSDYPPYPVPVNNVPVVPPIPQAADPVGQRIIPQVPQQTNYVGDVFRCAVSNDGFAIGDTWTGTSGAFTGTWTKQALELGLMIVWTKTA
jgi:hypothetical protein